MAIRGEELKKFGQKKRGKAAPKPPEVNTPKFNGRLRSDHTFIIA